MVVEKGSDSPVVSQISPSDGSAAPSVDSGTKTAAPALGEALDVYGDAATAEELGYVQRGLKSRHMQFMAIGGSIGTGLFLGIGGAFAKSGPLSVILGFSFTGCAVFAMMMCLGEMTTWLPLPGAIPQYCARYVDPAMGFAVGWNNWYLAVIAICADLNAAAVLVQFWNDDINPAVWISIIIVLIVCLNIFAVAIYGEAEFVFASIKILTILGLLLMAFIVDLGGSPTGDRLGFRYWYNPGPAMKEVVATGHTGRFLGLFSTLVFAAFAYGGVEMIALAAGEAVDPRRNVPKAVKRLIWRILIFYVLGSLAISVLVPSNHSDLGSASPWVIAAQNANIRVLPHIINAVIISSASSSANAFLFVGSRYLFGLAQNKQAPRIFLRCNKNGIPLYAIAFTAMWSGLAYMSVSAGAAEVFQWFLRIGTVASLLTWCSITIAFLRFRKALAVQGIDCDTLPFKSRFQPYTAWFALCFFAMIIVFNGWEIFTTGKWDVQDFITSYIGIPIYFGTYLLWKFWKRTSIVKPAEADLWTGKSSLDAMTWPVKTPRNFLERLWMWVV
ncbi:AAT family amino acid transporter [Exophiala aquamarina CBS 119918]|uniref:AAT family amino acid transporter n=1 Tax=Exophiala aquamarina CBS 119918 TaxID=1182545 RepID=A0A072PDT0_9EURO|nr:AAT family amino acid transporter [Exophiala aquamarina CBS 119918]KEF57917.1 AAT family amino acid transporter [Exophiala aquamarina CBS 119918]